jgi:hypothetical protein
MQSSEASQDSDYLISLINKKIDDELDHLHNTDWDENHISYIVVRSIRDCLNGLQQAPIETQDGLAYVSAQAYKVTGGFEKTYGDIAIAISFAECGQTGFGFYEAKAAGHHDDYPAYKMKQLRRLLTAAPRLHLLLYERKKKPVQDVYRPIFSGFADPQSARVRALTANLTSRFSRIDTETIRPDSIGHHFVHRYLRGPDLDFSRKPYHALKRWLSATKRTSPYLVHIMMSRDNGFIYYSLDEQVSAGLIDQSLPQILSESYVTISTSADRLPSDRNIGSLPGS